MKPLALLSLLLLTIVSCKKEANQTPRFTLHDLAMNATGTYTCTRYCQSGSGPGGYVYDTAYQVSLAVAYLNDSVLMIEGEQLSFAGNLDSQSYYFYRPASGGGSHARFDSSGHTVMYSYWNGGLGGGDGCTYYGIK